MREIIDEIVVDKDGYISLKPKGELVRCKDCRHRDPDDKRCDHGWMYFSFPRPDYGYCEHGER